MDFFLHLDRNLAALVEAHPHAIYALMFLVVFVETGLFLAMLPGDTLLFAAGTLAASHGLFNLPLLIPLMMAAAFCGDQINYLLGRWVGERPFRRDGRIFNRRTLERARGFYAQSRRQGRAHGPLHPRGPQRDADGRRGGRHAVPPLPALQPARILGLGPAVPAAGLFHRQPGGRCAGVSSG